ncbi:MAG: ABC transporter permease [Gemmatimonadales bacterium]
MSNPRFVLQMAWREARGEGVRRLALVSGAVIAGVAALVAINSFTQNLRVSVAEQARALLGADLVVRSTRPMPATVEAMIDSLIGRDSALDARDSALGGRGSALGTRRSALGERAQVISFIAMGYVPRTQGVRLIQVRAVEPGYPYYGEIRTEPSGRWSTLSESGGVLVDPVLLPALDASIGDTLAVGEARFPIVGTVLNVPGEVPIATVFGARVFIPASRLAETGLLGFGSRAEYQVFIRLPAGREARAIARKYRPWLREQRVGIRTVEEDQEDLTEALTRLGNYLGLVALIALLLGGLGVGSAVHVLIRHKLDTIAVLRCLGAGGRQVTLVYLLLAVAVAGMGSILGAGIGVAVQQVLPGLFEGLLPLDVRVRPSAGSILLGTGLGLWAAAGFAALPLLGVRRVPPLRALRRDVDPVAGGDYLTRTAKLLLGMSVVGLAAIQVGSLPEGAAFAAAAGLSLLFLWLAARGLIAGIRRWFPSGLPYLWRQGLANLYRPANQTVLVVLALGFGTSILTTLFVAQHNLLREFRPGPGHSRPNLLMFDIQPSQATAVAALIREQGLEPRPLLPIVPMRITMLRGIPVNALMPPDTSQGEPGKPGERDRSQAASRPAAWALRREYRSTYRDTLTGGERIVAGEWWLPGSYHSGDLVALISLEEEVARELTVNVGDTITWEVQGRAVPTRVANLREVEWRRFEPNFFVVFQSGVLDSLPQMLATVLRADSTATRARLMRTTAERFPNVTILDLSQIQEALERILDRGALIVRFLAFFSLVTGAVVLVGSIAATQVARIREAVLLKTLGATRRQVLRILIAEYLALGGLATVVSIGLASAAGWALFRFVFESSFRLPVLELGGLTALLIGLTLGLGLWNSGEVLKRTPLAVLREE